MRLTVDVLTIMELLLVLLCFQVLPSALCFKSGSHLEGFHSLSSLHSFADDDPFAANNYVINPWDDPRVQDLLWDGKPLPSGEPKRKRTVLQHRATGGRTVIPSTWPHRHCLGCFNAASGDRPDIGDLSTEYLVTELLKKEPEMRDLCVFYTGVPNDERQNTAKGQSLGPQENLSPSAARWACDRQMYSLWVRLHPR